MSQQTVEIIADSLAPSGERLTTFLIEHWRGIHPEILRHRLFSFSVASSRAIPYKVQEEQVLNSPYIPVLFPTEHKGMQGKEVFNDHDVIHIEQMWKDAKTFAVANAQKMNEAGVSKQLTNRILEPWVLTRCVVTATNWQNFFDLRAPWHEEDITRSEFHPKVTNKVGEHTVNLEFPAEYNIQDLALKMKKSLDRSEPVELNEGDWHLPFVSEDDYGEVEKITGSKLDPATADAQDKLYINLSAARCARTSYGKNIGKSVEAELKLADILWKDRHLSPFEHQGKAIEKVILPSEGSVDSICDTMEKYPGLELRIGSNRDVSLWSGNFRGWIQYRKVMELS
jgi:thymidylate synthase ThyX